MLDEKTQDFIRTHREEDVRRLALKPAPENVDLRMALQQIEGWQTARRKLPHGRNETGYCIRPASRWNNVLRNRRQGTNKPS